MRVLGIDFGTTTVSLVLMDVGTGDLVFRKTVEHHGFIKGDEPENSVQDPMLFLKITQDLLNEVMTEVMPEDELPAAIGLTGQMHGMLYIDNNGEAVSPLYTWQDECGNKLYKEDETYAAYIGKTAGAGGSGFGLTTHFYLQENGKIPADAVSMVTIPDYIAMKLCGLKEAFIAEDMAASWGCFDLEKKCFKTEDMKAAGIDFSYLPKLIKEHEIVGKTEQGIPVVASIGDNQAGFIGSVSDMKNTLLLNIGTGSQVSMASSDYVPAGGSVELRPCEGASYIMVGATLCGGRAYAMLEEFCRKLTGKSEPAYELMEKLAGEYLGEHSLDEAWSITPTFSGTRDDPSVRGLMTGIGADNFTPGAMITGMMKGMLQELHDMFESMCEKTGSRPQVLVGSGNAIRKNPLLREMAESMFGSHLNLPKYQEEAACGAAIHAVYRVGIVLSLGEAQKIIKYEA